jgi:CheY-like chemotaxis protein
VPKILAIDDKKDNLITLSASLKSLIPGCNVIIAQSGPEGIEKAKAELPDTILLDIKMPGMEGFEVCNRLKHDESTRHIPIIMISAIKTESEDFVKGLESGADAYLAKPIEEYVMVAQVNTALRIKKAEDQLRDQKDLLESIVQERTAELMRSNVQLKREINNRKQAEKKKNKLEIQLQQFQKMEAIGTLAGGIAHDFNNILSSVIGYTELALDNTERGTLLHNNLQEVLLAGQRACDLVKQILTFSRQADQELKPLNVQLVVKEALKLTRSALPSTIEIKQNISDTCGPVMADATQIHQVAMNLLTNAFHAMEDDGGTLEVTLKQIDLAVDDLKDPAMVPGPYICLTVADTGIGINKSVINRIFEPYFTTKEKNKGTGLGLATVHGILKSYKGDIRVYSEPGKRTEFQVYLPVIRTRTKIKETTGDISPVERGTERILFVDDEVQIARVAQQMLENLGYHVTARTSSIETLEAFRAAPHRFDLVITDMTMPNMTGLELAKKLMEIRPDIPIIICTGFSEKISEHKAKTVGIRGYVMKPVVRTELAGKIRQALDQS